MSQSENIESEPIEQTPIPSMLTNSAREVLDHFGSDIIELKAEASIDNRNRDELLRDYGLMRAHNDRRKVKLDYTQIRTEDGPENPLNDSVINDIMLKVNQNLGDYASDGTPDLAVSKLKVRTNVPELEQVTRAVSDEFELTFISDPAGEARDETEEINLDKGLYHQLGFEYRNLNLRSVVETRAKYTEQGDGKVMGWGGPSDVRPRCTRELARAVHDRVLPKEFRAMKRYYVGEDNVMKLDAIESERGEIA
jgi:hypothetical protein